MMTETTRPCSASVIGRPAGIPCHFARHPRQHVAVACCAMKAGCPRIGVCFPSLRGSAGASRWATKSAACERITSHPFASKYAFSRAPSRNRDRKRDRERRSNRSRVMVVVHFEAGADRDEQCRRSALADLRTSSIVHGQFSVRAAGREGAGNIFKVILRRSAGIIVRGQIWFSRRLQDRAGTAEFPPVAAAS